MFFFNNEKSPHVSSPDLINKIPVKSQSVDRAEMERKITALKLSIEKLEKPHRGLSAELSYQHSSSIDTLASHAMSNASIDTLASNTISTEVDYIDASISADKYAAYLHYSRSFEKKTRKREAEISIDDRVHKKFMRTSF